MMTEDEYLDDQARLLKVVSKAIQDARRNYPEAAGGGRQDRIVQSSEDSAMFAHAALNAIKSAGFIIMRRNSKQ
jgi:hypothetical protein